ncbi:M56 family metallopeptidase [Roseisolibacter agri]|uniref:Peptidase M56 domain-containing protein n=1 Tax=Roseisolibacter agri TaxID=2014610 RepID=A0AA37Q791_9BACT|nr:M56 family metallopeptidase [Roseisolibacter agri]GLC27859.1 hypothetical protein rosag_43720 [Roseisolibacter agri]
MLCILYVIAIGGCLGTAASLVERALPQAWPRRWVWCLAIALSTLTPPLARVHHTMPVADVPATLADATWWARVQSLDPTINRLWVLVSASLVCWGVIGALRVAYLVWRARRPEMVDGVRVVLTETVGPATVGLLRARVLVPRWVLALPDGQRRYVLQHEEEHRRAHDALLLGVASLTLVLLPWNLALWWQLRRLCLAVELDCDRRVVRTLGDAPTYGRLLLRVAEASSRGPRLQPALLGRVGTLERRLRVLLAADPRPGRAARIGAPVLALALLLAVLAMPHPVAPKTPAPHATHVAPR